jgi:hypothetical protein
VGLADWQQDSTHVLEVWRNPRTRSCWPKPSIVRSALVMPPRMTMSSRSNEHRSSAQSCSFAR